MTGISGRVESSVGDYNGFLWRDGQSTVIIGAGFNAPREL